MCGGGKYTRRGGGKRYIDSFVFSCRSSTVRAMLIDYDYEKCLMDDYRSSDGNTKGGLLGL